MLQQTVNISAQIPAELAKKLERVANAEERSKSYYIKKSLEKFLQEKLEDMEDYIDAKNALEEHKNSGQKTINYKDALK